MAANSLWSHGDSLQSPLLHGTLVAHPLPVTKQANESPLEDWAHLITLADKAKGTLQLTASLALNVGCATLRFTHAQRHKFAHDMCTGRTLVGMVSTGKTNNRAAFYVAGPTHVGPDNDLFGEMYDRLCCGLRESEYLAPEMAVPRGGSLEATTNLAKQPME